MKYIYLTLIALLLSGVTPLAAQETSTDSEQRSNDPDYTEMKNKLIALHLQELDSESYKRSAVLSRSFHDKLNYTGEVTDVMKLFREKKVVDWVKENFAVTEFESVEEAQKEYDAMMQATMATITENEAYHNYMMQAVLKYGADILTEATMYVFREHPEKMGINPSCVGK